MQLRNYCAQGLRLALALAVYQKDSAEQGSRGMGLRSVCTKFPVVYNHRKARNQMAA